MDGETGRLPAAALNPHAQPQKCGFFRCPSACFSLSLSCISGIIYARGIKASTDAKHARSCERGEKMLTEQAKEARREYKRQWARRNPDKVRAQQERHWERKAAEQRQDLPPDLPPEPQQREGEPA